MGTPVESDSPAAATDPVPDLGSLFARAAHVPLSAAVMAVQTIVEGLMLPFAKETKIPGLPQVRPEGDARLPLATLEAADLSPDTLRAYVARSEPVVIKNAPAELFDALDRFRPDEGGGAGDNLVIETHLLPRLGPLGAWIAAHVGKRALYLARFTGDYVGGFAHLDAFPSYNFYYVRRGRKRAFIIPREYTHLLKMKNGYDSVFVEEDAASLERMQWLESLPGYYDVELEPGDVLLFNNTGCVHKFLNLTPNPEIFTIRLTNADCSPLILRNDMFNWTGARYFASILLTASSRRDTTSV